MSNGLAWLRFGINLLERLNTMIGNVQEIRGNIVIMSKNLKYNDNGNIGERG